MPTPEERFWVKVDKSGDCWLWTGTVSANGYGNFYAGSKATVRWTTAHRYSYELTGRVISDGMTIDHLCRVRQCVNPDHLEVVTYAENMRRKPNYEANRTHCPRGHEYTKSNTYINPNGSRKCRDCGALYKRKARGVENVKEYTTKRSMGLYD